MGKVGDVFNLPLCSDIDPEIAIDSNGIHAGTFDLGIECEAAVLAINKHDALVEASEVMAKALESLCDNSIDISNRVSGIAIEALACCDDILYTGDKNETD